MDFAELSFWCLTEQNHNIIENQKVMELWTISLVTYILPFLLHIIGISLLLTQASNIGESQRIFMINLSLSEILLTLSASVRTIAYVTQSSTNFIYQFAAIFNIFSCVPYYSVMYLLTLDRFAEVYLNIRYPLYWSKTHSKYTMIIIWMLSGLLLVLLFIYLQIYPQEGHRRIHDVAYAYVFPVCDILFVIIASICYFYISKRLKIKRRNSLPVALIALSSKRKESNVKKTKRQNGYYLLLPTLLITTFVIFIEIPDLLFFVLYLKKVKISFTVDISCRIAYGIGYCSDAFIYTLLSTNIKNWIAEKLKWEKIFGRGWINSVFTKCRVNRKATRIWNLYFYWNFYCY